jgi:hypothetical protein
MWVKTHLVQSGEDNFEEARPFGAAIRLATAEKSYRFHLLIHAPIPGQGFQYIIV